MHTVLVSPEYIERLAQNLKEGTWYAHFWYGRSVIVVFKSKTFHFNFDNKVNWKDTLEYGMALGIPEEQLDFPIDLNTSTTSEENTRIPLQRSAAMVLSPHSPRVQSRASMKLSFSYFNEVAKVVIIIYANNFI